MMGGSQIIDVFYLSGWEEEQALHFYKYSLESYATYYCCKYTTAAGASHRIHHSNRTFPDSETGLCNNLGLHFTLMEAHWIFWRDSSFTYCT